MIRHNNNHYNLDAYPLFVARRPGVFAPGLLCHRHGARQLTTADLSFGWGTISLSRAIREVPRQVAVEEQRFLGEEGLERK
jgi:hypothetical protein